jgi:small subunit ribosomal protein S36
VLLATATWIAILVAYSLLVPLFRAPDELQHVDLVIASRTTPGYGDFDSTFVDARVAAGAAIVGRPALASTGQTADALERQLRPTLDELGPAAPAGRNQQTQHPPLYYTSLGAVSTVVTTMIPGERTWSFDRLVYLLRMLNVALLAGVPAITYLTGRRLGVSVRSSVLACLLVIAVPQLAHIGSSVNNDNMTVLLASLATLGAAAVTTGDLRRRRALGLGAVVGLALLTKATAFVLAPMVVLAYALHLRTDARLAVIRLAQAGGVALALGGWWWVKNVVQHGSVQPSDPFWLVPQDVDPVVGDWAERFFYLLPVRFWGHFGLLEVKLNRTLVTVGTTIVLGSMLVALARTKTRAKAAVVLIPLAGSLLLVARKTWSRYLLVGRPIPGIQGRYLFVGIVGMMVSVGQAVEALPARARRHAPLAGAALVVTMHGAAVAQLVRRFWGPPVTSWLSRLRPMQAFSPLPAVLTDLVVAGAVAAVAGLALVCLLDTIRPAADQEGEAAERPA